MFRFTQLSTLLTLVSLSSSNAHAAGATFDKGHKCTLAKALSGSVKKGKKTKAISIPAGSQVSVAKEPSKGSATLNWAGETITVNAKELETFCEAAAAAPEKPAVVTKPTEEPAKPAEPIVKAEAEAKPTEVVLPEAPAPSSKPRIALGGLAVPPGTRTSTNESVRELIANVVRDSPSLVYVQAKNLNDHERDGAKCVPHDACIRAVGQKAGADFVLSAWLKAEKSRGLIVFHLLDVRTGSLVKASERPITSTADLPNEIVTGTKLMLRDLMPEETGTLFLRVNEPGAAVSIDGKAAGTTPLPPTQLASGEHALVLEKPRFQPKRETLTIEPLRPNTVDVFVEPEDGYRKEYVSKHTTLRGLAWTGVGLGIAGAAGIFAFRVAANALYDDLQRNDALLRAQNAPDSAYDDLRAKSQLLPKLDGLTWGAAIVTAAGTALAITCFVLGEDPKRYDKPKRKRESDDRIGELRVNVSPTSLGLSGTF